MKNKPAFLFATIICLIGGIFTYQIINKRNDNNQLILKRNTLPSFEFYDLNLHPYKAEQIKPNKAVCVFYYNADCDFCQHEASELKKKIYEFKDVQIIMISSNTPKRTKQFAKEYNLNVPYVTWLYDKNLNINKWFGTIPLPSVFIYSRKHHLVKRYLGEVKIEAILNHVSNNEKI